MGATVGALHILDGTAALFRAYYGGPAAHSPAGAPTGALRGLAGWLVRFVRACRPTHTAVVFDAGGETFRNEIYADYKANRSETPPDLEAQRDPSISMTEALGFATFCIPGFEADDLMATLTRRALEAGLCVALVSPDKDVLQLLREGVTVLDPKDFRGRSRAELEQQHGVPPERMLDYLSLVGDNSDNVPGIRGIGPKAARVLALAHDSLDALYENLDAVESLSLRGAAKIRRLLAEGRDSCRLSRRLVLLDDRVPLSASPLHLGDLRWTGPTEEARTIFAQWGFDEPLRALATGRP